MAQHDMNIGNASGATVRGDLNNALAALVSNNSGATEPGTTFAYMWWVDSTSGTLKRRNAANNGWLVVRSIDETTVLSRSSNTMLDVSDIGKTIRATSTFTQTFDACATLGDGWYVNYVNEGSGLITLDPNSSEQIDGATSAVLAPGEAGIITCNGTNLKLVVKSRYLPAGIGPLPYAGSTIPGGWLECDGSAVSRTTYAALFAAIGTTWGVGDGSSTFNLPDLRGRTPIGAGTGTTAEAVTASSSNGFTVASNNTKWTTGMAVVLSNLSGFTTSASAGPTYYTVRISSTNVRLATTLALAQAGSPDVTISGTGTATLTHTYTARTLGEYGGEETHAMSSSELLAHTHSQNPSVSGGAGSFSGGVVGGANVTGSTGGNAGMNIMQPFATVKYIISY